MDQETSSAKRIVIIGGVAGGASAAARARRLSESADITLFERGNAISFANCGMPYHIGGAITERERLLVQTPESMRTRFRIDVRLQTEVRRIDREQKRVVARELPTGNDITVSYDVLILSPGAEPVRPPIPGIDSSRVLTLRSLDDMDAIKTRVERAPHTRAVVVGGGFIGLEMAEALRTRGLPVSLVEMASQVMGTLDPEMATPIHQHLVLQGVDLRLAQSVTAFEETAQGLNVRLSTGETIACGMAVLAIGVKPDVKLARDAGLAMGDRGGIRVDETMRTSDPAIFAVGDAVETPDWVSEVPGLLPLAGPANRQGRIAADNALGRHSVYRKSQGTAICKIFDLAVGSTGLNEKALKRLGRTYEKVYVHPASHAGYYPGAHPISLKLLFDPADGKILGAQAVGIDGVDKRIDVLAVAQRAGLTVFDLEHLELTYAPPYGSAKDPVNYAGFVAANLLRGDSQICHVAEVLHPHDQQKILDVRTPEEVLTGTIPGAINIPLDELRQRLNELPRDKEWLVTCQVGLRGYLACRILRQAGYTCRNLTGGYTTYKAVTGEGQVPEKEYYQELQDDTGEQHESAPAAGVKETPEHELDARGLQCPGPILRLSQAMQGMAPGQAIRVLATDSGFATDAPAWCHSTGNALADLSVKEGVITAVITKRAAAAAPAKAAALSRKKTIVVFSNDFDRVMSSFIIANGAASMGSEVVLFFTFWGLNVLRQPRRVNVKKNLVERMFGWMMPRGVNHLTLSKMNMGGAGTWMMRRIMKAKHVAGLTELIGEARRAGVRLVACAMTMDIMGIKAEELIEGVELGGVAMYLDQAESGGVNLFI